MLFQFKMTDIIKTKAGTFVNNVYTKFCGLNVPEDDIECESSTVISTDFLLVYITTNIICKYI